LLECPGITNGVSDGDTVFVDLTTGIIRNESTNKEFKAKPIDPFLLDMLNGGGLIPMAEKLVGEV
ncbi:hypothetical protein V7111_08970, partial [Neobacillus niacini]